MIDTRTPLDRQPINFERYGFDIWTAEIATMDHASMNLARLVYRVISLITDGFDALADGIQRLRRASPIEIEPVKVARPSQPDQASNSVDRAAA